MKKFLLVASLGFASIGAYAQSAIDAYTLSRQDLKGTARFMGMAGAFGALGADLTTLSYNPGGIGVYRSSDLGITMNLSLNNIGFTPTVGDKTNTTSSRFLLNNVGYVGTAKFDGPLRNFNWGFTYNRGASFHRRYAGSNRDITNSMSNYIAGVANTAGVRVSDLHATSSYDPYQGYSDWQAPWITILGYDSNLISPTSSDDNDPQWVGLMPVDGHASSRIQTIEQGGIDEYNIALGGNFSNVLSWGIDFGILNLDYSRTSLYTENIADALVGVDTPQGTSLVRSSAEWDIENLYNVNGSGFNTKFGIILKPIHELRLGFAAHTPTWWSLTEDYAANTSFKYPDTSIRPGSAETNDGYWASNEFRLRTPWRFIASAAAVIADRFIISADADWTSYQYMKLSSPYQNNVWAWDDLVSDPYNYPNQDIKDYYTTQTQVRVGAEMRVSSHFSVRAGYAHIFSPVKEAAGEDRLVIETAGTEPSYSFDRHTNYATCGLGYRYKNFYADAAYAYRNQVSTWHAFTPDPLNNADSGAKAEISGSNSQIVLTLGVKF